MDWISGERMGLCIDASDWIWDLGFGIGGSYGGGEGVGIEYCVCRDLVPRNVGEEVGRWNVGEGKTCLFCIYCDIYETQSLFFFTRKSVLALTKLWYIHQEHPRLARLPHLSNPHRPRDS